MTAEPAMEFVAPKEDFLFWMGFALVCLFWFPLLVLPPIIFVVLSGVDAPVDFAKIGAAVILYAVFAFWMHRRYRKSVPGGAAEKLRGLVGFRAGMGAAGVAISGQYLPK